MADFLDADQVSWNCKALLLLKLKHRREAKLQPYRSPSTNRLGRSMKMMTMMPRLCHPMMPPSARERHLGASLHSL